MQITQLNVHQPAAFLGTLAALALSFVGAGFLTGPEDWRMLVGGGLAIGVLVIYGIATVAVKSDTGRESTVTGACRGLLIGLNSAANFGLLWLLLDDPLGPMAVGIAATAAVINLLACIDSVSHSGAYKTILGWANWIMPMSWLVTGLGIIFVLVSWLLHLVITVPFGADFTRVGIQKGPLAGRALYMDWSTGTLFIFGGLVANLNRLKTAFNMGNFAFVHYRANSGYLRHEAGHTLNLAAFGSLFHLIGAVDEIFARHRAFAELLADSNNPAGHTRLLMW